MRLILDLCVSLYHVLRALAYVLRGVGLLLGMMLVEKVPQESPSEALTGASEPSEGRTLALIQPVILMAVTARRRRRRKPEYGQGMVRGHPISPGSPLGPHGLSNRATRSGTRVGPTSSGT